ncbi:DUF4359 domain-containing protein [Methylocaldum sp. SAD2]|uniref:DUF4359 domain-containing protein n=1 Tax=Methylocaldum sp. GT1BB TaxID=3438963 RepID=UPI00111C5130
MTALTKTIVIVSFWALLGYTNPSMKDYEEFIQKQILQESRKEGGVDKVLWSLFGGFFRNVIANETTRRDFVFFSLYDTSVGGQNVRVVGVLNNFFFMESLSLSSNSKNSSLQRKQALAPKEKPNSRTVLDCVQVPSTQDLRNEDLSHLKQWVGRYATPIAGAEDQSSFFAVPPIERRLRQLLSQADFEKITVEYATQPPIEIVENYLVLSRCRPHACSENASLAVGLRDGAVIAVLTDPSVNAFKANRRRCFALNGDLLTLPKNVREFLLRP